MERKKNQDSPTSVFKVGAIALAFLIIGYQASLFIHKVSVERIEAARDNPDTVFVVDSSLAARLLCSNPSVLPPSNSGKHLEAPASRAGNTSSTSALKSGNIAIRKDASHQPSVEQVRRSSRKIESFRFNPNTVSAEDLQRLGFSEKQAASIINYREKGGRFRRKSDFAKSYVVSDSVFKRLEPFIDIPKVDINRADSAAFDALPGIGGWFASKMVSYREQLGGYSFPEQLMDIYRFDREKYDALADLISCSPPRDTFGLWSLPVEELRKHPYIRSYQAARSIVIYRENTPRSQWSAMELGRAGIIPEEAAAKLARCAIK